MKNIKTIYSMMFKILLHIFRILLIILQSIEKITLYVDEYIERISAENLALFSFIKCICWAPLLIMLIVKLHNPENTDIPLLLKLSTIIFVVYTWNIKSILKITRFDGLQEHEKIKEIYKVFGLFYFICVIITFSKEDIINYINLNYIKLDKEVVIFDIKYKCSLWMDIVFISINSIKEAILTAIIFDTFYQTHELTEKQRISSYLDELHREKRIYILFEDQEKERPDLWCIRGDACADRIDEIIKYKMRRNSLKYIDITDEQAQEIIENRISLRIEDDNALMYTELEESDKIKKNRKYDYSFSLQKLEFLDDVLGNEYAQELIDILKEGAIVLPKGVNKIEENGYLEGYIKYIDNKIKNYPPTT